MCCWIILLAISAVLLEPAPAILLELTNNSVRNDGATFGDAVWTLEEETTDANTPYSIVNDTLDSGPGAACRQSSDCSSPLVCLVSKFCGCPERAPVLVREQASFACWMPRRLREPCLTHAECSHGNEHARCLGSVCQCPPSFRLDEAASLCLPASQPVEWLPQYTAVFLASLLSLAFAVLGIVGYRRLQKTRAGKNPQPRAAWSRRRVSNGVPYERFPKRAESRPAKTKIVGTALNLPCLRNISFGTTESQSFVQTGYEAPQISRDAYYAVVMEEDMQRMSASTANCTEPITIWNYARIQLHRDSGAIRDSLSQKRPLSTGPEASNNETLKPSDDGAPASPASTIKTEGGDKPSPKPRTKISTLSTYTLKPCRYARRVSFDSYSGPSAVDTFTSDTTPGYQRRGLLSVPEEAVENDANQLDGTPMSQTKPCENDKFTESELKGGPPKKIKSERLRTASPKRLRRALSDTDDPFAVIADEHADDRSNGYSAFETRSRTTCVVSSGTNAVSSGYNYEWPVESYVTLYADHEQEGGTRRPLLTASRPTGLYGVVALKGPDRVSRTCEAFVLHNGPRPPAIKARMMAPGKVTLMRPTPLLPEPRWKRQPNSVDAPRRRRRALRYSVASTEPRSAGNRTSTPIARTLTSTTRRVRSSNEPRVRGAGPSETLPMGRPCKSAPQAIRATRLECSDRASQTLDSAFVGPVTHSGSFFSFSSTGSDGSNLPLSASTILRSSRPATSAASGTEE